MRMRHPSPGFSAITRLLCVALMLVATPLEATPNVAVPPAATPADEGSRSVEADMEAIQLLMEDFEEPESEKPTNIPLAQSPETQNAPAQSFADLTGNEPEDIPSPEVANATDAEPTTPSPSETSEQNKVVSIAQNTESQKVDTAPETSPLQSATEAPLSSTKKAKAQTGPLDLLSSGEWKLVAAVLGVIALLALAALQYLKGRRNPDGTIVHPEKALQLISTLPIGQKRQVLLLKIRDTEIAVASTESGVSLLTEVSTGQLKTNGPKKQTEFAKLPSERRIPTPATANKPLARIAAADGVAESKSEILKRALETIEQKRVKKPESRPTPTQTPTEKTKESQSTAKSTPPPPSLSVGGKGAGPSPSLRKFLTKGYGQEGQTQRNKTAAKSAQDRPTANDAQRDTKTQSDNVAQLIREKLKQMKTIN